MKRLYTCSKVLVFLNFLTKNPREKTEKLTKRKDENLKMDSTGYNSMLITQLMERIDHLEKITKDHEGRITELEAENCILKNRIDELEDENDVFEDEVRTLGGFKGRKLG